MIPTLARLLRDRLPSPSRPRKKPGVRDLVSIRLAMLEAVQDCDGLPCERFRHKVQHAQNAQELFMLRNDAYQLIAQRHNQSAAATRINALLALFEGWIEPRLLMRIR